MSLRSPRSLRENLRALRAKIFRGFPAPRCVNRTVSRAPTEQDLIDTYRTTVRPLYAYVSRRVGSDASLAEDLVQDTWMRAVGSWPAKGIPDDPLAWLIRVARNTLVSHFRRVRPDLVEPALLDLIESEPSAAADDPGAASIVNWGLARLRRGQAELLEDFYFAGKSVREIARERALSERAVEGRLRRAREKLKKRIARLLTRGTAQRRDADGGTEHVRPTRTS
jgi:RNA polymerase sigma-70 factor (ECF subfamily)